MATKKAKQKKRLTEGETPITIGGGGGSGTPGAELTIVFDPLAWRQVVPGTYVLIGGNARRIKISAGDDVVIKLPLSGSVTIDLHCGRPLPKPRRR